MRVVQFLLLGDQSEQAVLFRSWDVEVEEALKIAKKRRISLRKKDKYYLSKLGDGIPVHCYNGTKMRVTPLFMDNFQKEIRANLTVIYLLKEQQKVLCKLTRTYSDCRRYGEVFPWVTHCHLSSDVIAKAEAMM